MCAALELTAEMRTPTLDAESSFQMLYQLIVGRATQRFCSGRLVIINPAHACASTRQRHVALGGVFIVGGWTGASIGGKIVIPGPIAPSNSWGGDQTCAGRFAFGAPPPAKQRQIAWGGVSIGLEWVVAGIKDLVTLPSP